MYSISPSYVPAVGKVAVVNNTVQVPAEAFVNVAVKVLVIVVDPTSLTLSLTLPLVKLTAPHVDESSSSRVLPVAAVLLSLRLKVSSG